MADINNPKRGDAFYYLGRTRCVVVAETLKPGGVNVEEALVQVRLAQGAPVVFLHKTSGEYLSETQIPFYKTWPLTASSSV